ncbi:LexA-binding, inner membrane-associated putative hydrolase [Lentzea atacamensis]|uniref:LexA-binding, inner membrane-associated putative hydrolase n=1 Tax=Lentzea atacamensis TaxID=531938 RepID=A0ABX9DWW4_9PSEU|nr:LexA-binding, inner membrane-associated putative hydrolase [Lentzea atacamensis]
MVGWLTLGVLLAADRLGTWMTAVLLASVGAWLSAIVATNGDAATATAAALDQSAGWLGIAVGAGCLVHCLGDAMTKSGCPILWPLMINGERWYDLRLPKLLRLRTGSWVEHVLIYPAVLIGCVLALPGVAEHLLLALEPAAAAAP